MQVVPQGSPPKRAFLDGAGGVALLLGGAAVVFCLAANRPLTHSELRYVEAGREMAESGDWVVPHLSFVPYFEKPILAYWLEAASQLAFGLGAVAVRLPMIVACVAMVWTTYAFGRAVRGPRFGLGAGALLVGSVMFQELGPAALTDPVFSAFLAFAWYAFWRHDRAPTSAWIWAFWTSLGFAMLTKGPLGLVLAGTTVGAYLFLSGRFLDFFRKARPIRGTVVIAAVNLPWWWMVFRRDPRFVEFFFVRENWQAFFNGHVNHEGAVWYYLPYLLAILFPFALLGAWAICCGTWKGIAPAVRSRRRGGDAPDAWTLYLACMFAPPFLFLSVSASKLGTYLLPLFPAAALLLAGYVADRRGAPNRPLRRATLAQGVLLCLVAVAVPVFLHRFKGDWVELAREHSAALTVVAGALLVPMLVGGALMFARRVVAGMAVVAAGGFVCVLLVNRLAPELGAEAEAGELVLRMNEVRKPDEPVIIPSPRVDDYSIVLVLRERPFVFGKTAELGMGHFTEVTAPDVGLPENPYKIGDAEHPFPANPWLLDAKELRRKWAGAERLWFVGRKKDVQWLETNGFDVYAFAEKDDAAVVTNLPLPEPR